MQDPAPPGCDKDTFKLFVQNIPHGWEENDLRPLLDQFGQVRPAALWHCCHHVEFSSSFCPIGWVISVLFELSWRGCGEKSSIAEFVKVCVWWGGRKGGPGGGAGGAL